MNSGERQQFRVPGNQVFLCWFTVWARDVIPSAHPIMDDCTCRFLSGYRWKSEHNGHIENGGEWLGIMIALRRGWNGAA